MHVLEEILRHVYSTRGCIEQGEFHFHSSSQSLGIGRSVYIIYFFIRSKTITRLMLFQIEKGSC